VGGYAPRAREDSVRPRRLMGASGRPLNFTVRPHVTTDRPRHLRKLVLWVAGACAAAALLAIWLSSQLSKCVYREDDPAYSADKRFYSQMQFTICQDHPKSRVRLIMGVAGKSEKTVLLDMGPDIGVVDVSWHEGPELHVSVAESAITKRYGPYEDLPAVVVTNP